MSTSVLPNVVLFIISQQSSFGNFRTANKPNSSHNNLSFDSWLPKPLNLNTILAWNPVPTFDGDVVKYPNLWFSSNFIPFETKQFSTPFTAVDQSSNTEAISPPWFCDTIQRWSSPFTHTANSSVPFENTPLPCGQLRDIPLDSNPDPLDGGEIIKPQFISLSFSLFGISDTLWYWPANSPFIDFNASINKDSNSILCDDVILGVNIWPETFLFDRIWLDTT